MMRRIFLVCCSLSLLLTGCVAAVVATTAAGVVVYDGRGVGLVEKDARIFYLINTAIAKDPRFRDARVSVTSFNQIVLLVGQVPNASLRVLAERTAKNTPQVARVYNELTVRPPISLAQIAKDAWITGEVRSQMLLKKGLESGSIRIVTENGVVYVMGIVTHEQANLAVAVARNIKGVQRVVKVFKYIDEN